MSVFAVFAYSHCRTADFIELNVTDKRAKSATRIV